MTLMEEFRSLTPFEKTIIGKLLSVDFPGRTELEEQITSARVRTIDAEGSIRFADTTTRSADVVYRVPVEAEGLDVDGIPLHALLHVVDGKVYELEFYKADSSPIMQWPNVETLEVFAVKSGGAV